MKHPVNQPCVICGGSRSRLLLSLDYAEFGYPGNFDVRECEGCALLFNSPRLSDADIGRLYDGNYYVFRERERDAMRRVAELAGRTIGVAQAGLHNRQLLEVGCAKGYMLALLQARGWAVRGVELSADAAAFARQRFGLDVFTGTLEQWLDEPAFAPSPVVLSTDVIEHVPDPDSFVAALARATAPGGTLVLGTPNAHSDHRLAHGGQWLGFNPFHIYLFSRDTLGRLLRRHGFEVELAYTYSNDTPTAVAQPPLARRLARAALRSSGLLAAARGARSAGLALADRWLQPTGMLLAQAGAAWRDTPVYLDTDDGRSVRREHCRGDNLVLIARRVTGDNE